MRREHGKIEFGADGDEEQAEQQALERLDRHFDFAPIFGFGEQQAGDEGAERHRQAAGGGGQGRAEHDQQAGRHEEFRAARRRDRMEQRPQHEAADDDHRGERQRGRRQGQGEARAEALDAPAGEHRRQNQQRRDREILKQQDGETEPPDRRAQPLFLGQHRNDDRGRGERQGRADHQRRRRLLPERIGGGAERQGGDDDLREAEPEHQAPHALEALERELQTDGEKQNDDAEGGEPVDRVDIGQRQGVEPGRLLGRAGRGRTAPARRPPGDSRAPG